jgi:DNA-binding transcriptional LysR family regulator
MNERQIRAFRLVIRHGSITAAANAMNISQPAVSRLIAELERSAGFPLLLRRGGHARPTMEALEFVQEVEHMFYSLERLGQVAREIRDLRRAKLTLATMPMISFGILPRAISAFLASHRGINITHDVHTSARIVDLAASRQIDLGIGQTNVERRDIDILASYRTHCVCALRPDHDLASRRALTPRDLEGQPLVALAHHTVTARYIAQSFAEANIQPDIAIESQPSYAACSLAAEGVGIAIVDPITAKKFMPRLVAVPFEPRIPFDFHVFKPIEVPLSRPASAFCDVLFATLADIDEANRLPP